MYRGSAYDLYASSTAWMSSSRWGRGDQFLSSALVGNSIHVPPFSLLMARGFRRVLNTCRKTGIGIFAISHQRFASAVSFVAVGIGTSGASVTCGSLAVPSPGVCAEGASLLLLSFSSDDACIILR